MASGTPLHNTNNDATTSPMGFDEFLETQLDRARRSIRSSDLWITIAGLLAGLGTFLLIFAICDQWIVSGGLPDYVRWILAISVMGLSATWLAVGLGRPSLLDVSQLYAAKELESVVPELKSNLLNWVDLKQRSRQVSPQVLAAIEKRTALGLKDLDVPTAVDHTALTRTLYGLLAVVLLLCLYVLVSPKSLTNALWRIIPVSNVSVATVTTIRDVQPGDVKVLARSRVEVIVDLGGKPPEEVLLKFTTADNRFKDEKVRLQPEEPEGTRFVGWLSGETGDGLQQGLSYFVEAGDARSKIYQVTVESPPTATIEGQRVTFPAYTKLDPLTVVGGSINAIEGSVVRLTAKANQPVRTAVIELLDQTRTKPTGEEVPLLVTNGTDLSADWRLERRADGSHPPAYRIQVRTEGGVVDPAPATHSLTIKPDLPPLVAIVDPASEIEAPANTTIPLLVEAKDADFEIGALNLLVERAGQQVARESIPLAGRTAGTFRHDLPLRTLGLKAGDEITYVVEALDNRRPQPNRAESERHRIKIGEAKSQKEIEKDLAERRQQHQEAIAKADRPPEGGAQQPPQPQADPQAANPQEGEKGAENQQMAEAYGKDGQRGDGTDTKTNKATRSNPDNRPKDGDAPEKDNNGLTSDGEDDQAAIERLYQKLKDRQAKDRDQASRANQNKEDRPKPDGADDPSNNSAQEDSRTSQEDRSTKPAGKPSSKQNNQPKQNDPAEQPQEKPEPKQANSRPQEGDDQSSGAGEEEASSKEGASGDKPNQGGANSSNKKEAIPNEGASKGKEPQPGEQGTPEKSDPKNEADPSTSTTEGQGEKTAGDKPSNMKQDGTKGQPKGDQNSAGDKSDNQTGPGGQESAAPSPTGTDGPKGAKPKPGQGEPAQNYNPAEAGPDGDNSSPDKGPNPKSTGNEANQPQPGQKQRPDKAPADQPKQKPATASNEQGSNNEAGPKPPQKSANDEDDRQGAKKGAEPGQNEKGMNQQPKAKKPSKEGDTPESSDQTASDNSTTDKQNESDSNPGEPGGTQQSAQQKKGDSQSAPKKGQPDGMKELEKGTSDSSSSSGGESSNSEQSGDDSQQQSGEQDGQQNNGSANSQKSQRGKQGTNNKTGSQPPSSQQAGGQKGDQSAEEGAQSDDEAAGKEGMNDGQEAESGAEGGQQNAAGKEPPSKAGKQQAGASKSGGKKPAAGNQADGNKGEGQANQDPANAQEQADGQEENQNANAGDETREGDAPQNAGKPNAQPQNKGQQRSEKTSKPKSGRPKEANPAGQEVNEAGDEQNPDGMKVEQGANPPGEEAAGEMQPEKGQQGQQQGGGGQEQGGQKGGEKQGNKTGQQGQQKQKAGQPPEGQADKGQDAAGQQGQQQGGQQGDAEQGEGQQGEGKQGEGQQGQGQGNGKGQGQKGQGQGQGGKGEGGQGKKGQQAGQAGEGGQNSGPGDGDGDGQGFAGGGGGNGDGLPAEGETPPEESGRQAAELVLKDLQGRLERGEIDPADLKELGWTEQEMRRFAERLSKQLGQADQQNLTPEERAAQEQFQAMLKSLELESGGARQAGKNADGPEFDQSAGRRAKVPAEYREAYEAYTRGVSKKAPRAQGKANGGNDSKNRGKAGSK